MKGKKIYTAAALSLLIILYVVIFNFSADDGESSSAVSARVTRVILNVYYQLTGSGNGGGSAGGAAADDALFDLVEGIVRKVAHFTEYMCMGILSYSIVAMWYRQVWKGRFLVVGQLFISAALDEFHQYFVPGRCASFRDVLIDVSGGIVGIMFVAAWMWMMKRMKFLSFLK